MLKLDQKKVSLELTGKKRLPQMFLVKISGKSYLVSSDLQYLWRLVKWEQIQFKKNSESQSCTDYNSFT